NLCYTKHIALGQGVLLNGSERVGLHSDRTRGACETLGDRLGADVDHACLAGAVGVCELFHERRPRSSRTRWEASSCGLTFPLARRRASWTTSMARTAASAAAASPRPNAPRARSRSIDVRASSASVKRPRDFELPTL